MSNFLAAILASVAAITTTWLIYQLLNTTMTAAKIRQLLDIIRRLQLTAVDDAAAIAALKKEIADITAANAELQDPELIAAVDAVIANAATTPPPAAE